jgi:cytochrome c peroxidase
MGNALASVASGTLVVAALGCAPPEEVDRGSAVETRTFALEEAPNLAGVASTLHTSGTIDPNNPFFQQLGTNPRSCATCHSAQMGWTLNSATASKLLQDSQGLDPLFNLVDEGTRPDADISTFDARMATFKTLVAERALTRFTRTPSATAEFTLVAVSDPYGWSDTTRFSNFRRPTPTANESKVSTAFWTSAPATTILAQVQGTGVGASRLHLQRDPANPLPAAVSAQIGDFTFGVIFAQSVDRNAGALDAAGARGGPAHLMAQQFYVGINDVNGGDPQGHPFNPKVFDIFDAWAAFANGGGGAVGAARGAIFRGQEVFNFTARCSGCHNAPNVGGHSVQRWFNIGTAEPPKCSPALPLLTLRNKTTGEQKVTCDLGRALATGLWTDIGRFRAPPLRGLAARAPYFHDGQGKDLKHVIQHYDERFSLGLSGAQKKDLEAFLRAL